LHSPPALASLLAERSSTAGLPLVNSGLQAGPGQPPIIARRAWARAGEHPKVAPAYGAVQLAFVHHTENPDGYSAAEVPAMLRSIYEFHRFGRGWNDIGYNFVIDRFGRIFEARAGGIDEPVIGAQAGGYNAYSTGIAMLGTYGAERISPAARTALERLLAWKLSLHGAPLEGRVTVRVTSDGAIYSRFPAHTPVSLPRVAGHRDADSTDCPGDALYAELQAVRRASARLAPLGGRATLRLQSPAVAGAPTSLAGSLRLPDGTPLAGAPIEIQVRQVANRGETVSELAFAQTLTDADGQWSVPIILSQPRFVPTTASGPKAAHEVETALRAVCRGGAHLPVVISEPLTLTGTVSLSPPAPSAPAQSPGPAQAPSAPSQAPGPTAPEATPPAA
jgi:uncharacterized protein with LGFP repeats